MSFKFVRAGAFLDKQPDAMPWIIEPLCLPGSSVMLYGRQKVGKSSAVVQLIHSLTTGEPWLGFPVRRTGPVLYLQLDMAQLELLRALRRAESAGLDVRSNLYIPEPDKGEHRAAFDILTPESQQLLTTYCVELKPVAVIVDTINDAYTSVERGDVNSFIREIHRRFMACIGDAALIFLNHKRKQIQRFKPSDDDDEDGYLGGSAWAGVVASNLEIARSKETGELALVLHDLRLDAYPVKRIPLMKDANGFFQPKLSSAQMLAIWPACLTADERQTIEDAGIGSMSDVFRDIAARTGAAFETVKKQYQRAPGVDYPWKKLIRA